MKYISITIVFCICLGGVVRAQEEFAPTILINEIQLGSAESATEEYVEIVNTSISVLELEGIELQYKSKNGSSWSTKAILDGLIAPYGRYLISNYLETKSFDFNGGLSGYSGHLRLILGDSIIDLVAWGEASEPDGESAVAHEAGQSMKRKVDEDGRFIDTDDNYQDWIVSDNPNPEFDSWVVQEENLEDEEIVEIIEDEVQVETEAGEETATTPLPPILPTHPIVISEVMPDPVSPLTDAEHEFVELFNPNSFAVELSGYSLEVGKDGRYKYTLGQYSLSPGEYIGVLSKDTKLALSNAGSTVLLIGRDGSELDQVAYEKAKPGKSWSYFTEGWEWASPTLNANNLRLAKEETPVLGESIESDSSSTISKTNIEYPTQSSQQNNQPSTTGKLFETEEEPRKVNNWVLAGVGGLTVLYAVYEYRKDIRIRIQQCRRYIAVRRENRQSTEGR